ARTGLRARRRAPEPPRSTRAPLRAAASPGDPQHAWKRNGGPPAAPRPAHRSCGVSASGIRALVVDDEQLARDRLVGFLAGLDGVTITGQAGDGVAALQMIEKERPDLVFLDVQM